MKKLYLLTVLAISTVCLFGQAADEPKDLNSNVMVAKDWSTVTTIENTFNAARRQEETQLGLGANAIQNLNLPDQTTWDGYSIDQKALYIMNDERTSRAGVNYGMGGVKGLPFNGIEANLDQVSQDWAQYNVDNNVFEHCHPDNMPANCPEGRIAGAYPNGCTEFGGGIENLYANSDGTVSPTIVTYDAIFGWIYVDATSNWGHRHAMLAQSYDDDYGDVGQEGFVGFGIAQTTNAAVTWKTIATVNFVNPVSDAEAVNCGYNITVSTNSLVPCNNPPVINSVSKVDPNDCNNQIGSITINATGGTLEYSVNGNTWQMSNTFTNLAPGSYSVLVRFANDPLCRASYNQNPVIISPAKGTEYALTNLNLGIPDDNPTGVESIINVPASGQITNVRITNLNVTHAWVADLNFSLISPMGTTVFLFGNKCGNMSDINLNLDDAAANAITCPLNAGNTERPDNMLSAFDGENPMGDWKLKIVDSQGPDAGILNSWTLEICTQGGGVAQGYTCATAIAINAAGMYNAPGPSQGNGAVATDVATNANWYRFTPPTTGMIRIYTCGLTNGGNNHFHVYPDGNNCPTNTNSVVYTADRGCAPTPGDASLGVFLENIPVTMGVPIYIEWDDALGNMNPFTWALEYQGGGTGNICNDYVATDVPKNIPDNNPTGVTSVINIQAGGTINDVNIKNLTGTHAYLGDLKFTLTSPLGTSVLLIDRKCGNDPSGFDITLDDQAAGILDCPLSDMATEKPESPLSAFNGENPMGNWTLTIADVADGDVGTLTAWTLEICTSGGGPCPPTLAVNDMAIASGAYQASNQLTSSGTIGAGNNVTFRAGNNVELQTNFTVPQTSLLEVKIEGCQ